MTGIVVAGRPYHIDPEINHGLPELITGYGVAVLTEDSVAHLGDVERPLKCYVTNGHTIQDFMQQQVLFVTQEDIELIQLNSALVVVLMP